MESFLSLPRIIVLFDIDCFFCQVASKRDPSLLNKAFVVHQHDDIISINYAGSFLSFFFFFLFFFCETLSLHIQQELWVLKNTIALIT